jgi:sugar lactone lactonase YvrE
MRVRTASARLRCLSALRLLGKLTVLAGAAALAALAWPPKVLPPNTTGDGGLAINAQVDGPLSVAADRNGDVYLFQQANEWKGLIWEAILRGSIRKIGTSPRVISTVAAECDPPSDKSQSECMASTSRIRTTPSGTLVFSEYTRDRVRAFDPITRQFSLIAGNGERNSEGDGGPAAQASIRAPDGLAVDDGGNIFISDSNDRIRKVDAKTGIISTVVGTGARGYAGDGGPAMSAQLRMPRSLAVDHDSNLYIGDVGNNRIRRVDAKTGIIQTVVGHGGPRFSDEGPGTVSGATWVGSLAVDPAGNLLFATEWKVFRRDRITGALTVVAGTGEMGFSGDGGLATEARIDSGDIAIDRNGNLFFTDYLNARIRRVDARTGIITTFAGNGLPHRQPAPGG